MTLLLAIKRDLFGGKCIIMNFNDQTVTDDTDIFRMKDINKEIYHH
jgi:hypothetical protein